MFSAHEPPNWAKIRIEVVDEINRAVGAEIIEGVPSTYTKEVKLVPITSKDPQVTRTQTAAWYADWLVSGMILSPTASKVIEHATRHQHLVENGEQRIFRGEAKLYASPCRSTLSRHISSTDPEILKNAVEQQERSIRKRTARNIKLVGPVIQQAGGISNTIDFSESPWTALWFATHRADGTIADTDGIVWSMARNGRPQSWNPFRQPSPKMKFHNGSDISTSDVEARIEAQQSILVESETGEVPENERIVMCEIPAQSKPDVRIVPEIRLLSSRVPTILAG